MDFIGLSFRGLSLRQSTRALPGEGLFFLASRPVRYPAIQTFSVQASRCYSGRVTV